MTNRYYVAVQAEGPTMRIVHFSTPLSIPIHGWAARSHLRADMPILVHQLCAAHHGVRKVYIRPYYVGLQIEEDLWTDHVEDRLINIILEAAGLDPALMDRVSYDELKGRTVNYVHALSDDELFVLV